MLYLFIMNVRANVTVQGCLPGCTRFRVDIGVCFMNLLAKVGA
jgi:hypothetical protein